MFKQGLAKQGMMKAVLLLQVLLGFSASHAQTMRPGLWDVQSKMGGNPKMEEAMAKMQQQLASMPPEQRKKMQEMMGQSGVSMNPSGGMSAKACISKEMVERGQMPHQNKGECTTTISDKSATGMRMTFVCENPPSRGEGVYTFSGDTAYTMTMTFHSKAKAAMEGSTMASSGKWVSADCGAVKPVPMPATAK